MCRDLQEDGLIPINKNLWSPSFVLCMASIAFLALALFFVRLAASRPHVSIVTL